MCKKPGPAHCSEIGCKDYHLCMMPSSSINEPVETVGSAVCLTALWDFVVALHQQEEKEQAAHGTQGLPTMASGNQM